MALHRWDVEVPFDASTTVSDYLVPIVLDRLPLFAGFFAKPIGRLLHIGVRTLAPNRDYVLELTTDGGSLTEGRPGDLDASLSLPAEAGLRTTDCGAPQPKAHSGGRRGHRQGEPRRPAQGLPRLPTSGRNPPRRDRRGTAARMS